MCQPVSLSVDEFRSANSEKAMGYILSTVINYDFHDHKKTIFFLIVLYYASIKVFEIR